MANALRIASVQPECLTGAHLHPGASGGAEDDPLCHQHAQGHQGVQCPAAAALAVSLHRPDAKE